jgi:predicted TIM-barrel fold metal-dependent hydrolase
MAGVRPPGGGASRDSCAGRDWRLFEAEVIDDAGRVVWAGAAGESPAAVFVFGHVGHRLQWLWRFTRARCLWWLGSAVVACI